MLSFQTLASRRLDELQEALQTQLNLSQRLQQMQVNYHSSVLPICQHMLFVGVNYLLQVNALESYWRWLDNLYFALGCIRHMICILILTSWRLTHFFWTLAWSRQDALLDEHRILASRPYVVLNDQAQYLKGEVERYRGLVDKLQVCS